MFLLERYRLGEYDSENKRWILASRQKGIAAMKMNQIDLTETDAMFYQEKAINSGLIYYEGQGTQTYSEYPKDVFFKLLMETEVDE